MSVKPQFLRHFFHFKSKSITNNLSLPILINDSNNQDYTKQKKTLPKNVDILLDA